MEAISLLFQQLYFVLFLALLGWGALSDYRDFIIPNRICLAIVALYPAYVMTSADAVDWMTAVVVALAVLTVTAVMFSFGHMGGGDVKFLSATALWAGPALAAPFLLITAVTGGILAVVYMTRVRLARYGGVGPGSGEAVSPIRIPYGVAIAAGGMFVVGRLLSA